ncbi:unnamed protein product [Rotaria sp. Silwood1]|nr:unnamed protein product [Rotaria sp. Silwood1]
MTLEEQIQEITADIHELKRVIDYTTRPRIKENLELQQRKFEKELVQLQEKLQKQQQQQQEQQQVAAQAEEKSVSASAQSTATRSYTKDISVYACSELINNNAVTQAAGTTTKSSELLDRYCDTLLRKGNQSIEETGLKVKIPSHNGATMHFKI